MDFNVLNAFKIKNWRNTVIILFKLGTQNFSLNLQPCQTSCINVFPESLWMLAVVLCDLCDRQPRRALPCAPPTMLKGWLVSQPMLWRLGPELWPSWTQRLPSICLWQYPERHLAGWQRSADILTLSRQLCIIHSPLTWAKNGKPFDTASC